MTIGVANQIIFYHNTGYETKIYAEKLVQYLFVLQFNDIIDEDMVDYIFRLSVDAPYDIQIEYILP